MKIKIYVLFCFVLMCFYTKAQTRSIIDDLNTIKSGEGKIVIYQDDAIKSLLGSTIMSTTSVVNTDLQLVSDDLADKLPTKFIKAKGYRIHIFSGNDQKRSKEEANARKSAILAVYPNMNVTISYSSPVWRVRAGNFKTQEQATTALNEMRGKFPTFGREMHVISDVVKIPVE